MLTREAVFVRHLRAWKEAESEFSGVCSTGRVVEATGKLSFSTRGGHLWCRAVPQPCSTMACSSFPTMGWNHRRCLRLFQTHCRFFFDGLHFPSQTHCPFFFAGLHLPSQTHCVFFFAWLHFPSQTHCLFFFDGLHFPSQTHCPFFFAGLHLPSQIHCPFFFDGLHLPYQTHCLFYFDELHFPSQIHWEKLIPL
uniref:Uncharacterized protein n=1 Tax=Anas zonorhyncha TaxID=75864 RepID=A0A8B9U667_9AVES